MLPFGVLDPFIGEIIVKGIPHYQINSFIK